MERVHATPYTDVAQLYPDGTIMQLAALESGPTMPTSGLSAKMRVIFFSQFFGTIVSELSMALNALLPENFDSPMAEALAERGKRRRVNRDSESGVTWGDEQE